MQNIWEVKSPLYPTITNENQSLVTISGYISGGLQRLSDESRGGGSILTHFLFLPVHLVGNTPSSEPWGLCKKHLTFFFCSRETQAGHSRCKERQLHAICTSAHWGCWWEPIACSVSSPGMELLYVHTASSLCLCTLSPISVSAAFDSPTPVFPLDALPSNLFSLFLLFYCSVEQKLSFGMAKWHLTHFFDPFLLCWIFWEGVHSSKNVEPDFIFPVHS